MIGRRLSHYEIVGEISRGGMGVVYRAVDVRLNREVALKILPEDLVADADRRRRFVQEAQAASALEHPNIAVIHEIDEADGITFIAMELVRGDKLADLLARRRPAPSRIIELAIEIAEGLARAHEKNIVHRDLKPANVMITEDGHVKIIDFGLAKLVEPESGYLGSAETVEHGGTDAGIVLGTLSYMSPEQAAGDRVDHRTDVFAFGVLFYEMLTGERPFQGRTGVDTLHAIINAPTPPLPELGQTVLPEATRELERIIHKCLEKEPADRYQGMRDIVVDLRAARRQLESGALPASTVSSSGAAAVPRSVPAVHTSAAGQVVATPEPAVVPVRRTVRWLPIAATAAAIVAAAGFFVWRTWRAPIPPASGSPPSVAVLFFENNTGNPSLDWLRTGLTDMVVTDLSQTTGVEVLGTDRLHRILTELNRADDKVISADVVDAVARRAGVQTVLVGSFVKAGDTIRINVKLQEAATGRIVTAERVEGNGEANIFAMVDELSRRIRARLLPQAAEGTLRNVLKSPAAADRAPAALDRGLKDVTTASLEAYRQYSEGIDLHQRLKELEAIPLLKKAIEIDPGFAMAYAKLAVIYNNLSLPRESAEYARRAFEHSDRLTERERLYIEGVHYSRRPETTDKAVAAYRRVVELYPDHDSARNNLALIAYQREEDDEVIVQLEELRRLGGDFPSTHSMLAGAYLRKGDFARGHDVLQEYVRRMPASGAGYNNLAGLYVSWGKYDDAAKALEKARALGARELSSNIVAYHLAVLQERWADCEQLTRRMTAGTEMFGRFVGWVSHAQASLYRGRVAEAFSDFEQAAKVAPPPITSDAFQLTARLLVERGELPRALAAADRARREAGADMEQWPSAALQAEILATMGRAAEADQRLAELRKAVDTITSPEMRRLVRLTEANVALARPDSRAAIAALTAAEAMLRPRPFPGPPSEHADIWYALGRAQLAAGDANAARGWFQRIVDSRIERVYKPIEFVRSFYFLGQIAERAGDREKAREHYRRFVGYWRDGELDRDRVAEALRFLAHP